MGCKQLSITEQAYLPLEVKYSSPPPAIGYMYDLGNTCYINAWGQQVDFNEIFNNYIVPNAIDITEIGIAYLKEIQAFNDKMQLASASNIGYGKMDDDPPGKRDRLKLNSINIFVYDGTWKVAPLFHSMQAGQHVRVEVKNMNLLGVQLDLQDKSFYHLEETWFGIQKKVYSGDNYSFMLLPYQTKTFDFYRFDYVPMNWMFELDTKISSAANVQIRFYSDWVPGMPYDPSHPNR